MIKLHHYFWNLGSEKQKSIVGLLRALLYQLLANNLMAASHIDFDEKILIASDSDSNLSDSLQNELQDSAHRLIESMHNESTVLILLDGLDELSGTDDKREQLIDFLIQLGGMEHVKLCVSSRPWNIFNDAFEDYPKLRLESLYV